ncbi:MAG: hypothetical protein H7331_10040 [Bacteroidia bacterium]|nr:hypothetical protein [Bacteroidia bacterium]
MKLYTTILFASCILTIAISLNVVAQIPVMCTEQSCKLPVKIKKKLVPQSVIDALRNEYTSTTNESWYGYPTFLCEDDWYGYNPNLYCDKNPEYYVVQFTKDKTVFKVIYSNVGKKIATYTTVNELPEAVLVAINKSTYANWKLSKWQEEIFKDGYKDDSKVYKVEVEKGREKHILFYKANGNLLKDKEIKP